jgi:hypothetical protein
MQLTTRLRPRRGAHVKRAVAPTAPPAAPAGPEPEPGETRDARRGGGPEDRALYACHCGFAFTAAVTTSVHCPLCGAEQAW